MSKKILSQQQQSNYDQVSNYLDIVFLAPDTVNLLKTDSSFRKVIQDDINIVSYYENEFEVNDTKAAKFIQAYHVITKEHVKINDDYSAFSDDANVEDMINYTNVYVNNVLGKSVNEIADSLKAKNNEPQEADVKDEQVETKDSSSDDYTDSYSSASDEDILNRSGYSMHDVADQLVQQQASILLNKNIATGKVYAFTSKPKLIPIIKWITVAAMALILAFSIASFAILMCTNDKIQLPFVQIVSQSGGELAQKITWQPATLMTPFPFQLLMVLLIVIMVIMAMVRNRKNDNFKFRYSWGWMIFYILMILMVTLIASGVQNSLVFNYNGFIQTIQSNPGNGAGANPNWVNGHWSKDAAYALNLIDDWRILQFVIYGLIGATIVCTVTGAVFNPKRDYERLQALLNQYVVEIRNGQVSSDDLGGNGGLFGSPFFGGFF